MPSVDLSLDFHGYDSEIISTDHLGTNMLFHSDTPTMGSDFGEVIAETGIGFIRYPGGTISEEYFDPANPNSE